MHAVMAVALSFFALSFFALDATPAVSWSTFNDLITVLTTQISVSTIMAVIVGVVGITVGIAFMWWGARFASRKLMAALKKGKTGP